MGEIWMDEDYHIFMEQGDGKTFQLVWVNEEQMRHNSFLTATWGYISKAIYDTLHRKVKEE